MTKRVFSGIQPTGRLQIGNYIGAISQWVADQDRFDNIFCVVDLHAITIPEAVDPKSLPARTREVAGLYIACGIDPDRTPIFRQSDVSAHSELAWILNCATPIGWLERMTQFKEKSERRESVSTGLFDYPVLMAADILLYETDLVPVGDDQKQHVELARDVAQRFNRLFGDTFVVPEPVIRESGARVMGLDDPAHRMSKSQAETKRDHAIGLLDSPDEIRKVLSRAVTDSGNEARFGHAGAGVRNLLEIYEVLSGETREVIEERFHSKGYGALKSAVADIVITTLEPIQARYRELTEDPGTIVSVLSAGADRVRPLAEKTLARAKAAVGVG
jgi:tryptophanyl-tRNA synthetase